MNETVFPVTLPIRMSREFREIGERLFAKSSLRQYNFGSDTRTVWNATIGVNERYRRLRYVVNGPIPGPSAYPPLHLVHATRIYAHNIELPTFSPYQSREGLTTNTENSDYARQQSSITLHYTTDPRRGTMHCRHTDDQPPRAFLNFYYQMLPRDKKRKKKKKKNIVHGRNVFQVCVPIKKKRKTDRNRRPRIGRKFVEYLYIRGEEEGGRGLYLHKRRRANET